MPWNRVVIQSAATTPKTPSINHSDHFMGPNAPNSSDAYALAAGVCLISGGNTRYSSHGTTSKLTTPGTIAPTAQRAYVTSIPVVSRANFAMIGFDACPVRNIAQTTTLHW